MVTRIAFAAAVSLAVALAACSKQNEATKDGGQPAEASTLAPKTAEDVAKALVSEGLKVTDIQVVTAENDGNKLLGRPGQYTSKVFFYDARHAKQASSDAGENTIEVFASPGDAKARQDYIAEVTKEMPMLTQYSELRGPVLVRFDKEMLPAEFEEYKAALAKIIKE